MNRSAAVFGRGKAYEYPSGNRAFYNFVCFPFVVAGIGVGVYFLITDAERVFPDGLKSVFVIAVFSILLVGLLFNYYHLGTIVVNEQEIISLKRNGPVSIHWKDISAIYYKIGRGKQLPEDPFFTVYIFSKNKNFIIVDRELSGIREVMDTIRKYANTSRAKYITTRQMIMMFVRLYLRGKLEI